MPSIPPDASFEPVRHTSVQWPSPWRAATLRCVRIAKPIPPLSIAVVDDDASIREAIVGLLRSHGRAAEGFASAEQFLGTADTDRFGCVVSDIQMPGMSGLDLFDWLGAHDLTLPVVLMTACAEQRADALAHGAKIVLLKPFSCSVLTDALRDAMALRSAH